MLFVCDWREGRDESCRCPDTATREATCFSRESLSKALDKNSGYVTDDIFNCIFFLHEMFPIEISPPYGSNW